MREIGREIQEREEKSLEKRRQWMGEGERCWRDRENRYREEEQGEKRRQVDKSVILFKALPPVCRL